jgi:RNA polymerase sigma-70 factor (ECF subfamily)
MRKPILNDQKLIELYLAGDEKSISLLINRYKKKIFTSIILLVKDPYIAEDIFQDTFLKIITVIRKEQYNDEGKFLQWSIRIARNMVIDYFRKNNKKPIITDSEGNDVLLNLNIAEDSFEDNLLKEETGERLRRLIQELPEEQREVLLLRHYADMSFKEISDLTGVSINTALGRMRYALSNLRKLIEKHQISF